MAHVNATQIPPSIIGPIPLIVPPNIPGLSRLYIWNIPDMLNSKADTIPIVAK